MQHLHRTPAKKMSDWHLCSGYIEIVTRNDNNCDQSNIKSCNTSSQADMQANIHAIFNAILTSLDCLRTACCTAAGSNNRHGVLAKSCGVTACFAHCFVLRPVLLLAVTVTVCSKLATTTSSRVCFATHNTRICLSACICWSAWRQKNLPCQLLHHVFADLYCFNFAHAVTAKRRNSIKDCRFAIDEVVHIQVCFPAANMAITKAVLDEQTIETSAHKL